MHHFCNLLGLLKFYHTAYNGNCNSFHFDPFKPGFSYTSNLKFYCLIAIIIIRIFIGGLFIDGKSSSYDRFFIRWYSYFKFQSVIMTKLRVNTWSESVYIFHYNYSISSSNKVAHVKKVNLEMAQKHLLSYT